MNAKFARFVVAGCHHAAAFWRTANGYGFTAQRGIVSHFDGGIKTIAVAMNNFALPRLVLLAKRNGLSLHLPSA